MKKIYYLGTCSTCSRIMKELSIDDSFEQQDIKKERITEEQLDQLKSLAGTYEALFSRVAMKYRALKLGERNLSESDYRQFILDEYTFLKRPVILVGDKIFIGNSAKVVAAAKEAIQA